MQNNNRVASYTLLTIAFILWIASLLPTALVFYGTNNNLTGLNILLNGWIGPLAGTFSWYANIFFLYSLRSLLDKDKIPYKSAGIALLLALTMFLFHEMPLNANAATVSLYGYGLGALLWLIAMCTNLLAVGVRELEMREDEFTFKDTCSHALGFISIGLILAFSFTFALLGIQDHKTASIAEEAYLNKAVFKLGAVCKLPDPLSSQTIILDEPLEIISSGDSYVSSDALAHPITFLQWGIPVVRKNGFDYALQNSKDINSVYVKPSDSHSSIIIESKYTTQGFIDAKLSKHQGSQEYTAFDMHWLAPVKGGLYCPRYITDTNTNEPLKTLVASSLISPKLAAFEPVTTHSQNSIDLPQPPKLKVISAQIVGKIFKSEIKENIGCPEGTGLFNAKESNNPGSFWTLRTKGIDFFTRYIFTHENVTRLIPEFEGFYDGNSALCKDDHTYLVQAINISKAENYPDIIYMDKRNINDFQSMWSNKKRIEFTRISLDHNKNIWSYKALSLEEEKDLIILKLAAFEKDANEGDIFEIIAKSTP